MNVASERIIRFEQATLPIVQVPLLGTRGRAAEPVTDVDSNVIRLRHRPQVLPPAGKNAATGF